jgi:hypothetical protein
MSRIERNRSIFDSAISGISGSTTSKRTRRRIDLSESFVVGEEEERTTRTEISN